MDNLKSPAYPWADTRGGRSAFFEGFTKLEKAALMIAAGTASTWMEEANATQYKHLAGIAVAVAKAVLEEANK